MKKEKEILTNPENILLEEEVSGFEAIKAIGYESKSILAARILNMVAQSEKKQLLKFKKSFYQNSIKIDSAPSKEELEKITSFYCNLRNRVYNAIEN